MKKSKPERAPAKIKNTGNGKSSGPAVYRVWLVLTLILTLIVFSKCFNHDFLVNWDDDAYILANTTIQQLNNGNLKEIFTSFHAGNYHPFTTLMNALEFKWFKLVPDSYHFINILFHLLNVLLVFFFIRKLTGKNMAALITCALFAIHPLHVESVAWISEQKDVFYTFFFLLSLLFYIRFAEQKKSTAYFLSLLFFIFSLLSKSAAVVLPLVLLLIDYYQKRKIHISSLMLKIPFFLFSLLFGILALQSQDAQSQYLTPHYTLFNSFFVASYALGFYIFKFFIPVNLSAFYPHPVVNGSPLPVIYYLSPLLIAAFAYIAWRIIRDRKTVLFGLGFMLVTIALVLQFFPVGGAVTADRYSYVPYIGLAFIISFYFEKLWVKLKSRQTILLSLATGVILFFAILSYNRTRVWSNGITLFNDVIEKHPRSFYAWHSRGVAWYYAGNYSESLKDYNQAIELNKNYGLTYYNRGLSEMKLKLYPEALASFNRAIELLPANDQAYSDRAIAYYNLGNLEEAINDCSRCISLNPKFARAYYNRGVFYYSRNEPAKACPDWKKAAESGIAEANDMLAKNCRP